MIVAITSKGNTLESEVDERFGRAQKFIIINTETDNFEVVDNSTNSNSSQGSGIQAGQTIVEKSVKAVITGNCGPKAYRTLSTGNVKIFVGAKGLVKEALEKYKSGKLEEATNANVEGHW